VLQARTWLPRTQGSLRLGFARRGDASALAALYQAGAARVRFPKPVGDAPEAVLLNTAGGLTGGDSMDVAVSLGPGARATVTTAAAEKVYRARDAEPTEIAVRLSLAAGSRLAWLPQPTILFDRSRLARRTEVALAGDASLLAIEMLVLGRMAMGEDVRAGAVRDAWRIRRDGVLALADTLRIDGAIAAALDRPATLAGARAVAMLVYAAPDAASRIDKTRELLLTDRAIAGASTWNGLMLVRATAADGRALQEAMAPLVQWLSGAPLPRVWQC
jgi:urease accessory protein